jgi:hypothetical protein
MKDYKQKECWGCENFTSLGEGDHLCCENIRKERHNGSNTEYINNRRYDRVKTRY